MTPPITTLTSLKNNYKKIDLLIPQAYVIGAAGEITKEIEPDILKFAVQHSMKIMPLVTNALTNATVAHDFLSHTVAQNKALTSLVDICKKNHFYGLQFDFEMINISDREAFTRFYVLAANVLHQNHLRISYAVAPIVTDKPTSLFLKKIYSNWEGAYDLEALGKSADFVSIMAYNQHGGPTSPGPTATLPWFRQTIKYALQFIPANKISIGIPDFSVHWYTGSSKIDNVEKVRLKIRAVNYPDAMMLAKKNQKKFMWDNESAVAYVMFANNWLNEYIFLEDKKSFVAKYNLVKKYKLRGISVFDLGTEDPKIWMALSRKNI